MLVLKWRFLSEETCVISPLLVSLTKLKFGLFFFLESREKGLLF